MNKITGIVLKTDTLQRRDFPVELIDFHVDEVAYISDSEFENIRNGEDSEILKQYNQKNYERNPNRTNGILVINTKGDGF